MDECAVFGEVYDKPETVRINKRQQERFNRVCPKCGFTHGEHIYGPYINGRNELMCPPEYAALKNEDTMINCKQEKKS